MPELVQRSMEKTQQVLREAEPEVKRRLRKIILELEQRYKV
jgi:hypothetical protein